MLFFRHEMAVFRNREKRKWNVLRAAVIECENIASALRKMFESEGFPGKEYFERHVKSVVKEIVPRHIVALFIDIFSVLVPDFGH